MADYIRLLLQDGEFGKRKKELHLAEFSNIVADLRRELHTIAVSMKAEARISSDSSRFSSSADGESIKAYSLEMLLRKLEQGALDVLVDHEKIEPAGCPSR